MTGRRMFHAALAALLGVLAGLAVSAAPAQADPRAGFPSDADTGVPEGVALTEYTGPCVVQADNVVFQEVEVNNCPEGMGLYGAGIRIIRSRFNTRITNNDDLAFSLYVEDSEIHGPMVQNFTLGTVNLTVVRSEVTGGQTAIACYINCAVRDSWLHGQLMPDDVDWHLGGFLTNGPPVGYPSNIDLTHNTVYCDKAANPIGGGCSGSLNLFGDFGQVNRVKVAGNWIGANQGQSYCIYGGSVASKQYPDGIYITFRDNVVERGPEGTCGTDGTVSSWNGALEGNQWLSNTWNDDGSPVDPSQ